VAERSSDFELLDAWRAGDAGAGNELFRRHFGAVCRFFRNKVGDGVDDLIQRTFLACVESKHAFRGDSSFRTYLFTIARHQLYAHIEQRHRPRLDGERMAMSDIVPGPSRVLARKREQRQLLEGLRRIPLDHQVALELYYWEDLPASELARILDVPEGTVRGRIRKGKALLQEALEQLASDAQSLDSTMARLEDWARSVRECVDADTRARAGENP
jgi:RNA polymerase sigma-70 factor (ECF subfamily)